MDSNSDAVEANQPDECTQETIDQLESDLNTIQTILSRHLEAVEIPAETPPEQVPTPKHPLLNTTQRIISTLRGCTRVEDTITNLKNQLKNQQFVLEQVELERDVLLQQVHAYLEMNSSLRVRLEEQRCQSGSLQKKANAGLELRIKSLEKDKEKLRDSNVEKDEQLHRMAVMLEQTTNCLRNKETEVLNRKNEENLTGLLKGDLRKVLEEKARLEEKYSVLKERLEEVLQGRKANWRLKRSLSVNDVTSARLIHLERNILLEPPGEGGNSRLCKNTHKTQLETILPTPWRHPNTTERPNNTPVHTQLNALRRDLVNVTRKLDALKSQLIVSGVIAEEENRSLKRKAKPMEETEDVGIAEGHKPEFRNLKNILQDAKNLNAKLENLREEKQRIIDENRKKEQEQFGPREFQNAVLELKKAVNECEQQMDGGVITEEEAFAGLVSPVFSCILSNLGCYSEWRRRTGYGDEGESTDETGEDGGGDNPLKILSSGEHCKEQIRLNLKMV